MKEVLIAIIAALPGLLTSLPILINVTSNIGRRGNKTPTLDRVSSIEVLKVVRTGLTDKELNTIESQYKILVGWFGIFSLFYLLIAGLYAAQIIYVNIIPFGYFFEPSLALSIYLSLILTFLYLPVFLFCSYQCIRCYLVFRSINVDQDNDRLLFFKTAQVRLNGEYTQIFNYARITLADLQPKSIDFDIDKKMLKTNLGSRVSQRVLNISIQSIDERTYDLAISYSGVTIDTVYTNYSMTLFNLINFLAHSFPESLSKVRYTETSSDNMNNFISRLILTLNQLETSITMKGTSADQKSNQLIQFFQKRLNTMAKTTRNQK